MKNLTQEQLIVIVESHKLWLEDSSKGHRADLTGANLRGANLKGADLRGADLTGADLTGANLEGANLRGADLTGANLKGANLKGANLTGADLRDADLKGANLKGANLTGADLRDADLRDADLDFSVLPLWCGAQFRADKGICQQLVAHTLRIMELSGEGSETLLKEMENYKKGWHREDEF